MYSQDLITRIVICINKKEYTNAKIMEIFKISKKTFYKIKDDYCNNCNHGSKRISIRKSKITIHIKKYIIDYVLRKKIFDCNKLVLLIHNRYHVKISFSSIYKILKANGIKKNKLKRNYY